MTNRKLVMSILAELSTKDISEATNPQTIHEHSWVARQGGEVARNARLELEQKTGQKVETSFHAKSSVIRHSLSMKTGRLRDVPMIRNNTQIKWGGATTCNCINKNGLSIAMFAYINK